MSASASQSAVQPAPIQQPPLNVVDALRYLEKVKKQCKGQPEVYDHFLEVMMDFKNQVIDTPNVVERLCQLFHRTPRLIEGFNTFLPVGYHIDGSTKGIITLTTPTETITHDLSQFFVDDVPTGAHKPAVSRSAQPTASGSGKLNVADALSYLDAVRNQYSTQPEVYDTFLDVMMDFKSQKCVFFA
ncbi:paired amphipathic helix [Roridomyces roridus]|uniref:Paired amphipathic helix n=1 Tax=Roridomyces roridus TaxID=1738132 RepID=A0AAD7AXE3_9AGAR|nr:paired amphipathic helix [Roridomyces roridus]